MNIDLGLLSSSSVYHLMTQSIIPRPIAWVLSENTDASHNLAPFSYFNAIASDPPLCVLSMGKKPSGGPKDTAENLTKGSFCVVHIASADMAADVTATAATLDYGESELEHSGLVTCKHENWKLPRVTACPIAFYCKVYDTQEIGNAPQQLVFVEILSIYIDDAVCGEDEKGRLSIDALKVNPLARLGANQYASLGEILNNKRPN
ncbi:flavin reductase family protein [Glaciecola sp. MH2013]|uniref:flavin reductase family protein n=1 Tax=Glaciecola sp. MH2013 TaxID=2785524 RepID=UPI00189C93CA|nr:flavin reductase family protein [Glaciecola sp. MH2013]MBF7074823.1 flavin reductase family protein [Glaciecola sp. MH2013]